MRAVSVSIACIAALAVGCGSSPPAGDPCGGEGPRYEELARPASFRVQTRDTLVGTLTFPAEGAPTLEADPRAPSDVVTALEARIAELSAGPELPVGYTRERMQDGVRESYVCSQQIGRDDPSYPAAFVSRLHSNVLGGARVRVERL